MYANLGEWVDLFREVLRTPSGIKAAAILLRYIALVCDEHFETFRETLRKQLPEAERAAMTIAEQLRHEGRQEGRQEGHLDVLVRLLIRKFGSIPSEYTSQLAEVREDQIDDHLDRILAAKTLAEVFAPTTPTS